MTETEGRSRPTLLQAIPYWYGKRLPASMRDWVRNDLAGPGATARMVAWWALPCIIILIPMWLVPATLYVHASMSMPILISYVYFSFALNRIWRRNRLEMHNLDPALVDAAANARDADRRRAYEERHRPGQQ